MTRLAVPNVSEGRDFGVLTRLERSLGNDAILLDRHSDIDHNRAVFTLTAGSTDLVTALVSLSEAAVGEIDMPAWQGLHPCVGALDVCPIVWTHSSDEEAAAKDALEVAKAIGESGVPVFLYGSLASEPQRKERSYFRDGGLDRLWQRMSDRSLRPDFGPDLPHVTAGATLVTSRPPMAAFNIELDTDQVDVAESVAADLREGGGGLPGVRAIGLLLSTGRVQVSTNIHDPFQVSLAQVVEKVAELARPFGASPIEAELIRLLPEKAIEGYPESVPIRDFNVRYDLIERRLI